MRSISSTQERWFISLRHRKLIFAVDMEIYAENDQYVDDKGESSSKGEYNIQM